MRTFHKVNFRIQKTAVGHAGVLIAVFLLLLLFLFLSAPDAGFAQANAPGDTFGLDPIGRGTTLATDDIRLIIARIIRAALGLLGIIALVIVIAAGWTIMTAGGDEQKITTGKAWLKNGVIGLAIILSAFSITHFIITRLGAATGSGPPLPGGVAPPPRQSFAGSGALGRIVKDHYPLRDQTDVARNTSIAVTFREAIDPSSIIMDANRSNILGDCVTVGGQTLDLARDCDRANPAAVSLAATTTPGQVIDMTAMAIPQGAGAEFYTFVFQPLSGLGSDTTDVGYIVDLKNSIKKAGGRTSAFVNDRSGHYTWQFLTGTKFDFEAPTVQSAYPGAGASTPRNSVLQIHFSEPMHPSVTQGLVNPSSRYYHMIFGNAAVTGEWRLTNGYRTVEFVSDQVCDPDPAKNLNSCGEPMYCLPVACTAVGCEDPYQALLRTALLLGQTSFQSVPFSGLMDMANNALDGDKDSLDGVQPTDADGKPGLPSDQRTIGINELAADNFVWNFKVKDSIDTEPPHVEEIEPAVDEEDVQQDALFEITFSKPMWFSTLSDGITLEEYGLPQPARGQQPVAPVWFRQNARTARLRGSVKTIVDIDHRIFGPNNEDAYYFTAVSSTVKSLTQNCLYPGVGPKGVAACTCNTLVSSVGGVPAIPVTTCDPNACIQVSPADRNKDTACAQNSDTSKQLQGDVEACLREMRSLSPVN